MSSKTDTPPDIRSVLDTLYQVGIAHADINISFDTSANFRIDEALKAIESLIPDPWDYVQPCEPDCTPERHAYHEAQWDMAQRMSGRSNP